MIFFPGCWRGEKLKFNMVKMNAQDLISENDAAKSLKCSLCVETLSSRSSLLKHYRVHTQEKPFTCKVCNRLFGDKCCLDMHFKRIHERRLIFKCPCGAAFVVRSDLIEHMIKTMKKFICKICLFEFNCRKDLVNHSNVHFDPKIKCHFCAKIYVKKAYALKHMMRHIMRGDSAKK